MAHTLISADNTWALWAIIIGWAAVSIWLEQKYKWASKISGAIIALLGTLILSNIGVIPQESSVYDAIWDSTYALQFEFKKDLARSRKNSSNFHHFRFWYRIRIHSSAPFTGWRYWQ